MFKCFTVYTDDAALYWILTIEQPSGRLIGWRPSIAEFDLEITYNKACTNTKADSLSMMNAMSETNPPDYNGGVPVCDLELVNFHLEFNEAKDDTSFIDVQYVKVHEIYPAMDDPAPPFSTFELIYVAEVLRRNMPQT